jgi:hypothetical protein
MGTFNYFVDIEKDISIDVEVDLNVSKFVSSFTNIDGYLAVAEASADAFGQSTGDGVNTYEQFDFLLDDYSFPQSVDTAGVAPPPINATDGPILFTNTSIPLGLRELAIEMTQSGGATTGAAIDIPVDFSSSGGTTTNIAFSNDDGVVSNQYVRYTSEADPYSIIISCEDPSFIDYTDIVDDNGDPTNSIVFEGVDLDAENGTVRIEATIEDADGTSVTACAFAVSDNYANSGGQVDNNGDALVAVGPNETLIIPLGVWIAAAAGLPPALDINDPLTEALGGAFPGANVGVYNAGVNVNAAGAIAGLDLTQVVNIEFAVLGDDSGFTCDTTSIELPGKEGAVVNHTGTDVHFDLIRIATECCTPGQGGQGALSETETFAQVDQFSGFTEAFSSSLAATNDAGFEIA